ncbi:MAG: hypothetical protein Athens071416_172 [Parcubacteria group bacterium Athens0714_16]|nr:MAG: hypothetical protein Athens071416_172 [Parcubacteria group bacterium Athens0714_16]
MNSSDKQDVWNEKVTLEVKHISNILKLTGFELDIEQPHISGERYLMTRDKLVLVGTRIEDNLKVIIKVSDNKTGREEIRQEKKVRDALVSFTFSQNSVIFPTEIYFGQEENFLIWITKYINQEKVFASYSIEKQFFMILKVFEDQESFHATTFEHLQNIRTILPILNGRNYIEKIEGFKKTIFDLENYAELKNSISEALKLLQNHKRLIDMYCNYLTHTDLAPANFRIQKKEIYTIDLSSILFGNKYDGWARFLNWTIINSPILEKTIIEYVKTNRDQEEYLVLRLMRIYKATFLIDYYIKNLSKTSGNLHLLTKKRIELWTLILKSLLNDSPMPPQIVHQYMSDRDKLRSPEEKERQKEFNLLTVT